MREDLIYKIVMEAMETEEDFIFKIIQPFCEQVIERKISKKELIDALTRQRDVMFSDDDRVLIDGKQFVSLDRFLEVKNSGIKEMRLMNERVEELIAKNKALITLLKISS